MTNPALSETALDQLFLKARSYNGYVDAPVSEGDLRAIWELVRMGPTSVNMLPARLVWCHSVHAKDRLAALASESNGAKIRKSPVTVIIGMDVDFHEHLAEFFPHNPGIKALFSDAGAREVMALRNSSLQGAYLILAARALGFDVGPMSGFNNAAVDAAFFSNTPSVKSNFIATIGHGDPATVFDRLPRPDFERVNQLL